MSRRDNERPDLSEWTMPDLFALRAPDDPTERSAQRSELQASWTGEIPVLTALADDHAPAALPAAAARGRHAAADDAAVEEAAAVDEAAGRSVPTPTPDSVEVHPAPAELPRRRGRHAAADETATDETGPDKTGPDKTIADDDTDVIAAIRSTGPIPLQRRSSDDPDDIPAVASARFAVKRPLLIALAAVICLLTAGGGTAAAMNKTVTVTVDGQQREVSTLSSDVAGALSSAGLNVGEHDTLAPAPNTPIRDGSKISLDRGRQLTVVIDGRQQQIWTTARTVDAALAELDESDDRMKPAADRSRPIPLQGLAVRGDTLRTVQVSDAGRRSSANTSAGTVGELLAERKVRLGGHDTVSPTAATPLTDGMTVSVTRRGIARTTVQRSLPQPAAKTITDAKVERHTTTVTKGRAGAEKLVYETVTTNGKVGAKRLVSRTTVRAPEATTTHVGSAITQPSDGWNVPWDQLADCESTGRWDINTGNGTYGGIQFMTSTWLQYGGGQYAPRADLATKDQQIAIGEKLYAAEGLAPWACARILGWGFDQYTGGW